PIKTSFPALLQDDGEATSWIGHACQGAACAMRYANAGFTLREAAEISVLWAMVSHRFASAGPRAMMTRLNAPSASGYVTRWKPGNTKVETWFGGSSAWRNAAALSGSRMAR